MTITAPSSPLYVGDSLTLQCQVEISDAVDTTVDVSYTWKKSGAAIAGDSDTLNIMSVTTSTGGSYSCEAMATPSGSTEFILPSGVGMGTTDVVVQGSLVHAIHVCYNHVIFITTASSIRLSTEIIVKTD